jgi:hypothetical protein
MIGHVIFQLKINESLISFVSIIKVVVIIDELVKHGIAVPGYKGTETHIDQDNLKKTNFGKSILNIRHSY